MILQAVKRWAPSWSGQRVHIKSDSEVAAAIIDKVTTPCLIIMDWIRELFWLLECHAIHLTVDHIPGSSNVIADSISRLDEKCHQDILHAWLSQSFSPTKGLLSHLSPLSLVTYFSDSDDLLRLDMEVCKFRKQHVQLPPRSPTKVSYEPTSPSVFMMGTVHYQPPPLHLVAMQLSWPELCLHSPSQRT